MKQNGSTACIYKEIPAVKKPVFFTQMYPRICKREKMIMHAADSKGAEYLYFSLKQEAE